MAVLEDKQRVQITFPKPLLQKLDAYCKETGMTRSGYVAMLVSKDLDDTDKFIVEFKKQLEEIIDKMGIDEQ